MDVVLLRSLGKSFSKRRYNANFYRLSEIAKQRRLQWALEHAGAAAHRAKTTSEAYKNLRITKMLWSASSPDLNPIENV